MLYSGICKVKAVIDDIHPLNVAFYLPASIEFMSQHHSRLNHLPAKVP